MSNSRPGDNFLRVPPAKGKESQRRYGSNPSQPSQAYSRVRDESDDEFDKMNASQSGGRGKRDKKLSRKVIDAQEHGWILPCSQ